MRCYTVTGLGFIRYAGSQGEAKAYRTELMEQSGKRKDSFEITQVEVPTGKEGLLNVLNTLAEKSDPEL